MPTSFRSLVPYAHVRSVPASVDFYSKLGFTVTNAFTPPGGAEPSWAWLQCGEAALMMRELATLSSLRSRPSFLSCTWTMSPRRTPSCYRGAWRSAESSIPSILPKQVSFQGSRRLRSDSEAHITRYAPGTFR